MPSAATVYFLLNIIVLSLNQHFWTYCIKVLISETLLCIATWIRQMSLSIWSWHFWSEIRTFNKNKVILICLKERFQNKFLNLRFKKNLTLFRKCLILLATQFERWCSLNNHFCSGIFQIVSVFHLTKNILYLKK